MPSGIFWRPLAEARSDWYHVGKSMAPPTFHLAEYQQRVVDHRGMAHPLGDQLRWIRRGGVGQFLFAVPSIRMASPARHTEPVTLPV